MTTPWPSRPHLPLAVALAAALGLALLSPAHATESRTTSVATGSVTPSADERQAKPGVKKACRKARKLKRQGAPKAKVRKAVRKCRQAKKRAKQRAPQPPRWAAASSATITPGVQMVTSGAQCIANFVFLDAQMRVHLGYAAHCASSGSPDQTDGCSSPTLPLGTRVRLVQGETLVGGGGVVGNGTLVYSSWTTMQRRGVTDRHTCAANDFALVRVDKADWGKVNPSVPRWGGPTRLATGDVSPGETVHTWGQSSLRLTTTFSAKSGTVVSGSNGGWSWEVLTLSPGIPGDSGSGFLDSRGQAFGTLSTLNLAPLPGTNGVGDLRRELAFAQRFSGISGLRLVPGTEPFTG
ncbi:hypothetical protein [Nocardioides sp.]|uniref:hypothetical protein n=1 Tax=Nocardioides sp. TaxID=35761 RepID=UPI002734706A|nr:hypothetical protein [Nocardioides sp.]MDP3891084.1 hypothetical protein [Nocardioides sp.]